MNSRVEKCTDQSSRISIQGMKKFRHVINLYQVRQEKKKYKQEIRKRGQNKRDKNRKRKTGVVNLFFLPQKKRRSQDKLSYFINKCCQLLQQVRKSQLSSNIFNKSKI